MNSKELKEKGFSSDSGKNRKAPKKGISVKFVMPQKQPPFDVLTNAEKKEIVHKWLNNLCDNKVLFRQESLILARLNIVDISNESIIIDIVEDKTIIEHTSNKNQKTKCSLYVGSSWEKLYLSIAKQTLYIPSANAVIWCNPKLIQTIIDNAENKNNL